MRDPPTITRIHICQKMRSGQHYHHSALQESLLFAAVCKIAWKRCDSRKQSLCTMPLHNAQTWKAIGGSLKWNEYTYEQLSPAHVHLSLQSIFHTYIICIYGNKLQTDSAFYIHVHACVYICTYVCMYTYIYVHTYDILHIAYYIFDITYYIIS